jgi:hypothetical protein
MDGLEAWAWGVLLSPATWTALMVEWAVIGVGAVMVRKLWWRPSARPTTPGRHPARVSRVPTPPPASPPGPGRF